MSGTETSLPDTVQAELMVGGMTCGACAARIERRLNRLDGVAATVNYATGRAYFASTGGRDPAELIGVIESVGYTATAPAPPPADGQRPDPETRALARRLVVCVPLAVAVIVLSMVPAAQFPGWQWVSLLLAAPVATWGAWPLHRAAWYGLGHGAATMDTLVSVGVGASFSWSVYALLFGGAGMTGMKMSFAFTFGQASGDTLYLEAAAGVTAAVLAGRFLEARARDRSGLALSALAALGAKTAAVLRDGAERRVPVTELAAGDLFVVRPGEKIATDGIVTEGRSAVDASLVTGESMPAEVGPGDPVTGATVNMSGRLVVRATQVGADTLLAQITRLVSQAQATKASAQRLADRIAAVFVPCVIAIAVATLGFWLGAGLPAASAWSAAVAVLVVACPCALGLATPTALLAAVGRGAELGILVRSAQAIETAGRIRTVALDKTGTLTTGTMTVLDVITDGNRRRRGPPAGRSGGGRLRAPGRPGHRPRRRRPPGRPAAGHRLHRASRRRGARHRRGPRDHRRPPGPLLPALPARPRFARSGRRGRRGGAAGPRCWPAGTAEARAAFVVADQLKPHAAEAVARIRRLGIRPLLVTGDNSRAARSVAARAGHPGTGRPRRGQARGQGGGGPGPAGGRDRGRPGRRRGQRRRRAGPGRPRDGGRVRRRRRHRRRRPDPDRRRPAEHRHRRREPARATMSVIRANLASASGYNLVAIPLAALGYLNPLFAGVRCQPVR